MLLAFFFNVYYPVPSEGHGFKSIAPKAFLVPIHEKIIPVKFWGHTLKFRTSLAVWSLKTHIFWVKNGHFQRTREVWNETISVKFHFIDLLSYLNNKWKLGSNLQIEHFSSNKPTENGKFEIFATLPRFSGTFLCVSLLVWNALRSFSGPFLPPPRHQKRQNRSTNKKVIHLKNLHRGCLKMYYIKPELFHAMPICCNDS